MPPLQALVAAGHDVALVVTRADKRRGRGGALVPSPVKAAAVELGLPVTDQVDDVLDTNAELGVVVAFGRLIKPHVLERVPMINVHFSLLPRWRGAAPVERALLAGDAETGVCIMQLEEGLDTGPVYACERITVGPEDTADSLRDRLVDVGTELLVDQLANGVAGLPEPTAQEGEPTYAAKIDPAELQIDWSRPAVELDRVVRLGRAWTTFRGKRLLVLRARPVAGSNGSENGSGSSPPGTLQGLEVTCGEGSLALVEVQPEGKAAQAADAWARGARLASDERLGASPQGG